MLFNLIIDLYFLIPAACNPYRNTSQEAKTKTEMHPVIAETKIRKCSINLFVLSTHQIILLYFFMEIISCFVYIFSLNS